MSRLQPEPAQPPESSWRFVQELQSPLWHPLAWPPPRPPRRTEASLAQGVTLQAAFPDPRGRLDTAYRDLECFLDAAAIPRQGPYPLVTRHVPMGLRESFGWWWAGKAVR